MAKKTFKVAGVTFRNNMFGASRQEIIKKCSIGDSVVLEQDYSNKHDDYAVKVLTEEGAQIGFIPKGKANSKRVFLSLGENDVTAKISDKYSFKDDYGDRIYGIEIEVGNLLSASEAKEIDQKGCAAVVLLFLSLITLLKIIF